MVWLFEGLTDLTKWLLMRIFRGKLYSNFKFNVKAMMARKFDSSNHIIGERHLCGHSRWFTFRWVSMLSTKLSGRLLESKVDRFRVAQAQKQQISHWWQHKPQDKSLFHWHLWKIYISLNDRNISASMATFTNKDEKSLCACKKKACH